MKDAFRTAFRIYDSATQEGLGQDEISTQELFLVLVAVLHRMDRLEVAAAELANIVLYHSTDMDAPSEEIVTATLDALVEFANTIANEHKHYQDIRKKLDFLNSPE